tara:strand:+ start:13677 stop:15107 length:1431 start_codon:yes stop_codon:yes gene_type:complete
MEKKVKSQKWQIGTAIILIILAFSQTLFQFSNVYVAQLAARFALIVLCIFMVPLFKIREWILVWFALSLTIVLFQMEKGKADLILALDRASFFAAFIYLVTLLKEAAQRSVSVQTLGVYLASQPKGRRYYTLAFGGHITGILLNFGAISLLSPMIQRGAKPKADASLANTIAAENSEQQQISALIRGFTWMVLWSPTSLAQVVLFTTIPDADVRVTIPIGIVATFVMIYIGRLEDRARWRNAPIGSLVETKHFPKVAAILFSIVCTMILGPTIIIAYAFDVRLVLGLMAVVPAVIAVWFFEQDYEGQPQRSLMNAGASIASMLRQSATGLGHSAMTLGLAGFIGIAASKIAPVDTLSQVLEAQNIPDWLLLISLPIVITLFGQIALSPILSVVFLGSVLSQFQIPPANPNLIFFSLGIGWALSMLASPNASASLLISGITNIPSTTLTWRWNGRYAVLCFAAFTCAVLVSTLFFRT